MRARRSSPIRRRTADASILATASRGPSSIRDSPDRRRRCADLALPNGETWRLSAKGAALSIEESIYFAELSGPLQTMQIVLRNFFHNVSPTYNPVFLPKYLVH